jgi:hypothetical protein
LREIHFEQILSMIVMCNRACLDLQKKSPDLIHFVSDDIAEFTHQ